jgi:hypothetical protein
VHWCLYDSQLVSVLWGEDAGVGGWRGKKGRVRERRD